MSINRLAQSQIELQNHYIKVCHVEPMAVPMSQDYSLSLNPGALFGGMNSAMAQSSP